MSIYKACDMRGRYGEELREEHATRLGQAIAQYADKPAILVGGDGRLSTPTLKAHLIAGLSKSGCRVIDLGILPTPALYYARRHLGIYAAVMVTASHNPAGDNGFKISLSAAPIRPEDITALSKLMEAEASPLALQGEAVHCIDILPAYVSFAVSQAQALDGLKVVVDCANGAASLVAQQIWQATGAQVSYLYDTLDGNFPNHAPDPSNVKNITALCQAVKELGADMGVAYDGDADRVIFVDANGKPLSGDKAIVIFARQALANEKAPIVYDQKCSLIVADAIRNNGGEPVRERSGHTFIKTSFLRLNAPYAGEISGHHFFRLLQGDDGIIASLYMANLLKASGQTLAQIGDAIKTYPITPDIRLKMDEATAKRVLADLKRGLANDATLTTLDGLRADFADGWGMARQSVTEPAITLRFEGKDEAALQSIVKHFELAAPDLAGRLPALHA
jgi:phosphomannomutase/phosphoglucomutase